jgi:hypothetical protein
MNGRRSSPRVRTSQLFGVADPTFLSFPRRSASVPLLSDHPNATCLTSSPIAQRSGFTFSNLLHDVGFTDSGIRRRHSGLWLLDIGDRYVGFITMATHNAWKRQRIVAANTW